MSENQLDTTAKEDASAQKQLCSNCIGESYLKSEVEERGDTRTCSYCGNRRKALSIQELAVWIETALDHHYQQVPEQTESDYNYLQTIDTDWEEEGELIVDVIADAAGIEVQAAEDIRLFLEHRDCQEACAEPLDNEAFNSNARYLEKEPNAAIFHNKWILFENSIKEEARFFSRKTLSILDEIFGDLINHKTSSGDSVIIGAGPNKNISKLYRTRVFQSHERLRGALIHPDVEIGPPPARMVKAGRMNALGISVFYGSQDIATAIAEVRPPVGSRVVAGCFDIIRSIHLLDVAALRSITKRGSIFDVYYLAQLRQANFLKTLSNLFSRPVMPDDESLEYITTQAIASYFATEIGLDGIIYPSAQTGKPSANVVLFHHAAFVEPIIIPSGVILRARLNSNYGDGLETDYCVIENIPTEPPKSNSPIESDITEPTLKLNLESLVVYHISSAIYSSNAFPVGRVRIEEGKSPKY